MSDAAWNVLINILASGITGALVWLGQRGLAQRRLRRKGRFFGLRRGEECLLVIPKHPGSQRDRSVNREDVVVLLDLSGLLQECGARPRVLFHDQAGRGIGLTAEFCIGGPAANSRSAAHMRLALPGLAVDPYESGDPHRLALRVGADVYLYEPGVIEHALLAKIAAPSLPRPVFLVCGQTAIANQGAVDYLLAHRRELVRAYGLDGRFALVTRVVQPADYGRHAVELVRDATADVFAPLAGHVDGMAS